MCTETSVHAVFKYLDTERMNSKTYTRRKQNVIIERHLEKLFLSVEVTSQFFILLSCI